MITRSSGRRLSERARLGLVLWLAGMAGVVIITVTALPRIFENVPLPAPLWMVSLASLAQSAVLLALAVWAGVALGPAVGLRAPAFESAVTHRPLAPALRAQLRPGLAAGLLGGLLRRRRFQRDQPMISNASFR